MFGWNTTSGRSGRPVGVDPRGEVRGPTQSVGRSRRRYRPGGPHLDSRSDERGHPIEASTVDRLGDVGVDDLGNVARDLFTRDQVDGSSRGVGDCGRRRLRGSGAVRTEPAQVGPDGLAGALRGLSERTLDVGGDIVEVESGVEVKVEPPVEPPGAVAVRGGESLGGLGRVGWAPGGDGFFGEGDCRRGRVSALEAMGPPAGHPGQSLIPLALGFGERAPTWAVAGSLGPVRGVGLCHLEANVCSCLSEPRDDYSAVICNTPGHSRFLAVEGLSGFETLCARDRAVFAPKAQPSELPCGAWGASYPGQHAGTGLCRATGGTWAWRPYGVTPDCYFCATSNGTRGCCDR